MQHLSGICTEQEKQLSKVKKRLKINLANFGLAIAGKWFPLLGQISGFGIIYISWDIHKKSFSLLKEGKVGVDTLVSIVTIVCLTNQYFIIMNYTLLFYSLIFFFFAKMKISSQQNMIDIFKEIPSSVWILQDEIEIKVPLESIEVGDIIVVNTGDTIPIDGIVIKGSALVEQHMLTGESQPAEKEKDSLVFASTVVLSGRIFILVQQAGNKTVIAEIGKILHKSSNIKVSQELKAEALANQTIAPTLWLSAISLPFIGQYQSVAILNSHFKYRLNFISHATILNFLNILSHNRILMAV